MKIATELLTHTIEVLPGRITSVVVEEPKLFRNLVWEFVDAAERGDETIFFSEGDMRVSSEKAVEVVQVFVPFTLNTKNLTAALIKRIERLAIAPDKYLETMRAVAAMSGYVRRLALEVPHAVECDGLTIAGVLKACALRFAEEEGNLSEQLLGYFRLVREFVGERVYVLVNARTFLSDEELKELLSVCQFEQMKILLLDGVAKEPLPDEDRLLVDKDLCELTQRDDDLI